MTHCAVFGRQILLKPIYESKKHDLNRWPEGACDCRNYSIKCSLMQFCALQSLSTTFRHSTVFTKLNRHPAVFVVDILLYSHYHHHIQLILMAKAGRSTDKTWEHVSPDDKVIEKCSENSSS